ncbi:DUF4365 domain-containing protein [Leptospira bandrabouensis]|uniref:DUF4365 domain-containing protein n=1 Tax=Leptospira bandrabouensis TaxID=2484903 RepID=UPI001EE92EE9|nr:DUF4365 domain-containing protein [Leptospira bandrabouensis]MCG6146599.1 DUF4365 domain-containing protein [Leptospira bandrabouensis]MCG6161931.1 DUF4365 domain-containing protein [Leptospira bandrabouensis]MCG6166180.1 DUF4365 domain-containing protein [Leptospira bandrabouensis]
MNSEFFPKRPHSHKQGSSGYTYFSHFVVNDLGWICHSIPQENDYGIDALVEIVTDEFVKGQWIAIQIKHGNSYFKNFHDGGYKYYGKNQHLNYYLNLNIPVLLIILDNDFNKKFWTKFEIDKTSKASNGWWIEIPEHQKLNKDVSSIWQTIAGPPIDFSSAIKNQWYIDSKIEEAGLYILDIPKSEIISNSYNLVMSFLEKLMKNQYILRRSMGAVDIVFSEYDNDPREISEIPEIMEWLYNSVSIGIPWAYFLRKIGDHPSFKLIIYSLFFKNNIPRKNNQFNMNKIRKKVIDFMTINLINLNNFTDFHNLPESINRKISEEIFLVFMPIKPK